MTGVQTCALPISIRKSLLLLDPNEQQLSLPLGIPEELRRPAQGKKNKRVSSTKNPERINEMTKPKLSNTSEIRRRTSRRVRRNRMIALAIAGLIGIAGWYQLFGPGAANAIPSVVGGTKVEAIATMEKFGIKVKVKKSIFDELVPKGKIITMSPPAGSRLAEGESITVVLSKGPERYEVPNVKGKNLSEATVALANAKLVLGKTQSEFSATVPKDRVISLSPEPEIGRAHV